MNDDVRREARDARREERDWWDDYMTAMNNIYDMDALDARRKRERAEGLEQHRNAKLPLRNSLTEQDVVLLASLGIGGGYER